MDELRSVKMYKREHRGEKDKLRIKFSVCIFIIYSLYFISGYTGAFHNYINFGLFCLWNFFAYCEDRKSYTKAALNKTSKYLFLFLLFYFFTSLISGGLVYTLEYIFLFMMLYGNVIQYKYYITRNNYSEIKILVRASFASILLFSVIAITFYSIFPSAARILAADYYAFDTIAIGGGYAIAFGASLLSVFLTELIIRGNLNHTHTKYFMICVIFLLEFLLVKTESTLTLLSSIIGILFAVIRRIYFGKKTAQSKMSIGKILAIAGVIIIGLFLITNFQSIGLWILDLTSENLDNVVLRRFNRIAEKIVYSGNGTMYTNYIDERWGTVVQSWNTFLSNPIFGVGYECGNTFSLLGKFGVGTHSELCDLLAQHGVFGGISLFTFFILAFRGQHNNCRCRAFILTLLFMALFNPFRYYHGYFVCFFLIPMIDYLITHQKANFK